MGFIKKIRRWGIWKSKPARFIRGIFVKAAKDEVEKIK